jgi:hypothetical protein
MIGAGKQPSEPESVAFLQEFIHDVVRGIAKLFVISYAAKRKSEFAQTSFQCFWRWL